MSFFFIPKKTSNHLPHHNLSSFSLLQGEKQTKKLLFTFFSSKLQKKYIIANTKNMQNQTPNRTSIQYPMCPVCLIQLDNNIASLACGHCFHRQCIQRHLQLRKDCPNCRRHAGTDDIRIIFFAITKQISDTGCPVFKIHEKGDERVVSPYTLLSCKLKQKQKELAQIFGKHGELQEELKQSQENMNVLQQNFQLMVQNNKETDKQHSKELKILKILLKAKDAKLHYLQFQKECWSGRYRNKWEKEGFTKREEVYADEKAVRRKRSFSLTKQQML